MGIEPLDPRLAPLDVLSLDDYLDRYVAAPRFNMATMTSFAVVAILIAAVGMFGIIANAVARRVREMGIRMALGARAGQVRNQPARRAAATDPAGALRVE